MRNIFFCVLAVFSSLLITVAQNTANSPYSMFGFGDLTRNGFSYNKGMGGISTGLRKPNYINYLNPASYTSQDSMSFIFDVGGSFIKHDLATSSKSVSNNIFNIDYLAGAFPITRWWSSCFGLVPYSRIGYKISQLSQISATDPIQSLTSYTGNGGINQAFIGNAFSFYNHFSIGFNLSYLFGSLNQSSIISHPNANYMYLTHLEKSTRIGNAYLDFGTQYYTNISEKVHLTIGAVYNHKTQIKVQYDDLFYKTLASSASANDTFYVNQGIKSTNTLPTNIGGGFTLVYDKRYLAGFDLYRQNWGKVSYPWKLGFEVTPVINSNIPVNYFARIHYRAGMQSSSTYLILDNGGYDIKDLRFSAGLGLPILRSNNEFNISAEFGQRGTTELNLVRDRYMFISFSFRFYDFWFYRKKYN